jgi:hypothetical protein
MAAEIITAPTADPGTVAAAAAKTEIRVGSGGSIPTPATAPAPRSTTTPNTVPIAPPVTKEEPKKGSGLAKLNEALRKKAGVEPDPDAPKPAEGDGAPKPAEGTAPAKPAEGTAPADGKETKGKANPWKLLDETKKRATELETKLHETEKRAIPEAKFKEMETALEAQKKRNDELESHIRLMDYSKSSEYQDKYQKPYEAEWGRAMSNLKGFTVQDGEGNEREFTADDMLSLVNAPNIREAWTAAEQLVGEKFAPMLMQHRNEIRKLYDQQAVALEQAKKNAGDHAESLKKTAAETNTQIMAQWTAVNDEAKADPVVGKYFSQVEGDSEGNQKLGKGYELVDRAFTENPNAPGLNAEQRKDIIARHAVVRNRAAAFGRLRHWYEQAQTKVKALEKELAEYKGTEPTTEGTNGRQTAQADPEKGFSGVMNRIRKKATPI